MLSSNTTLTVLRRRAEFLAVAGTGKKWVAPGLIVQLGNPHAPENQASVRYGLTASGKVGGAVVRNRARRRLRALAIELLPLHAEPGRDYVLIARATTTVSRDYTDLKKDLLTALRKLRVYRE